MIQLEGVYKYFGAIRVLQAISLSVAKGHALCVLGPSGCGKTTLLKVMALITPPDRGTVTVDGSDVRTLNSSRLTGLRSMIAYSFQEPLLLPYLNALENLVYIVSVVRGLPAFHLRSQAAELLTSLGLSHRLAHPPSKLSVGEKKRVDLARAILKAPSLMVVDEPLSNLDPDSGRMVMNALRAYVHNGGTLIYSSVEPSEARFADHLFLMGRQELSRS